MDDPEQHDETPPTTHQLDSEHTDEHRDDAEGYLEPAKGEDSRELKVNDGGEIFDDWICRAS